MGFTMLAMLVSNSWSQEVGLPRPPKVLRLQSLTLSPRLECSGVISAHCHHQYSSNSLALASQIARITGIHHDAQIIFVFLVETVFYHVGQSGLKLLTLSYLSTSTSQ
ncbi:Zinc finger protein, partial [Plecturocebus cupreus]